MPRDGSGNYNRPAGQPVSAGTVIDATVFNTLTADIATALTGSVPRDGQAPPLQDLPMGGFKFTGLSNGLAATDSVTLGQAQGAAAQWLTSIAGTANAVEGTASPAISAYAAGQTFRFVPASTNTGATTLKVGALSAQNVFAFGAACVGGELVSGVPTEVVYDGTRFNIIGILSSRLNYQQTAFLLASTTTTNLNDATYTRINLAETIDPGNNVPASNYYVAPAAGNYFVFGAVQIAITNAAASTTQVAIERANGGGTNISTGVMSAMITSAVSTPQVFGATIIAVNAGDRLYLNGYQNNGGVRVAQSGGVCFLGGWRLT